MAMANLMCISFVFVESQTFSPKTGGTWALETFLAFAKIYIFSSETLFSSDYYQNRPTNFWAEITLILFTFAYVWFKKLLKKGNFFLNF